MLNNSSQISYTYNIHIIQINDVGGEIAYYYCTYRTALFILPEYNIYFGRKSSVIAVCVPYIGMRIQSVSVR